MTTIDLRGGGGGGGGAESEINGRGLQTEEQTKERDTNRRPYKQQHFSPKMKV